MAFSDIYTVFYVSMLTFRMTLLMNRWTIGIEQDTFESVTLNTVFSVVTYELVDFEK